MIGGSRVQEWRGTPVAGGLVKKIISDCSIVTFLVLLFATHGVCTYAAEPKSRGAFSGISAFATGNSASQQRKQILSSLPLNRLTPQARERILAIAKSPTIFRRLPTQAINCDRDMFLFLTRKPETLVGMWDLMGITKVKTQRTGPYQMQAEDGAGTTCKVDLIYGDSNLHIFIADGSYDGKMTPKPIRGSGVFVLRSSYAKSASGGTTVTGSIDCFVKFDSLGTDLVARTLSGVIGRSADNNFVETARFVAQVSQASEKNPPAMLDVARRLPQVDHGTKQQFANVIQTIARRAPSTPSAPRPRTAIRQLPTRTK